MHHTLPPAGLAGSQVDSEQEWGWIHHGDNCINREESTWNWLSLPRFWKVHLSLPSQAGQQHTIYEIGVSSTLPDSKSPGSLWIFAIIALFETTFYNSMAISKLETKNPFLFFPISGQSGTISLHQVFPTNQAHSPRQDAEMCSRHLVLWGF